MLISPWKSLITDPNYYIILLLIIIAWFISFKWMNMYISYRQQPFYQFFAAILKSNFMGMILVSIVMYFLHIQGVSRLLMGIFLILNIFLLTLSKFIVFKVLEKVRTDGINTRNVLIVGSKKRARELIEVVNKNKSTGYIILGCFVVDELIFAMSLKNLEHGDRYLAFAENMGIKVRIVPDWELHYLMYRPDIAAISFEDFLGVYTMALQSTPHNEGKMLIKHVTDFFGALILIILLSLRIN